MAENAREQLLDLLDRRVFDPILSRSADDLDSEGQKDKLRDVQSSTRSTKHRYHENYESAQRVRDMFHGDLSASGTARRIQDESRQLGLPTLDDVRDDFDSLCDKLHV